MKKKLSEQHKENIAKGHTGLKQSSETIAKRAATWKAKQDKKLKQQLANAKV